MDSFVSAIVSLVIKTVNIHFIQSPNYSFYSIAKLYFVNSFATSFLILSVKNCADELQKLIERTYAAKRKAAKLGGKNK